MGQKTNPIGLRIGYTKNWQGIWIAKGEEYKKRVLEDIRWRNFIKKSLPGGGINKIIIERIGKRIRIIIHTSRPGIVIGKGGEEIERLRKHIQEEAGKDKEVQIDIEEIKIPELEAQLIANNIANQIERRIPFRRAMRQAVNNALRYGAEGIKVACKGRLAGVEIARCEWYRVGRLPLQTMDADIDYAKAEAATKYGNIGVKVWVCKGIKSKEKEEVEYGALEEQTTT